MIGMGTIVNMAGIAAGGILGLLAKQLMQDRIRDGLMKANALCVIFIGAAGALQKLLIIENGALQTQGSLILITAFALGTLLGELLNLEHWIERFGIFLREKTGNSGDDRFLQGFLTASFTVCVGAMAIVGALEDGIAGDPSILFTKAILDFLIILVMSASLGKGCIFAAIPVGIFQGSVTLLARLLAPLMTEQALSYISMTGSILIFCVGVNLLKKDSFRVSNMLPVILVAALLGIFLG